jgi:hypothetical protein
MHLLLALHCVSASSLSTLDPTHPISLSLSLRVSIPSYLTDALVSWKERELPSQSEHLKHTTTTTTENQQQEEQNWQLKTQESTYKKRVQHLLLRWKDFAKLVRLWAWTWRMGVE